MFETSTYTDSLLIGLRDFISWAKWLFILAFVLTIADLRFGLQASKERKEAIRKSRALKRTINKICSYLLWVVLAYCFGKAFGTPFGIEPLPVIMLIVIYGVELESIYSNYFEAKGKKIKVNVLKFFGKKTDIIEVEDCQKKSPPSIPD
jgi:hypothetical protein